VTIAQRFGAGDTIPREIQARYGRQELESLFFFRPYRDLSINTFFFPALKRWAIVTKHGDRVD